MFKADLIKWLEKVPDEEPLFVVRGQDVLAPGTIRHWCQLYREQLGLKFLEHHEKHDNALRIALDMSHWTPRKLPD